METLFALLTGIAAGAVHVALGPDHVVGVAALATNRVRPAVTGAIWGFGHGAAFLLAVAVFLIVPALRDAVVSLGWMETVVGAVMIVIGIATIQRSRHLHLHAHEHDHDGHRHRHLHFHRHEPGDASAHPTKPHQHGHQSMWLGLLHGVAGGSHWLAASPVLLLGARAELFAYIAGYIAAGVITMAAIAAGVGALQRRVETIGAGLTRFGVVTGALSCVVGAWWIVASL